jgi:hypothetical protein
VERIQRVPRGLQEMLSLAGGQTPQALQDTVFPTLDLLQLYGMTQLQARALQDAALAEGGTIDIDVPATQTWILFSAAGLFTKTATMTALSASIQIGPINGTCTAVWASMGPFGATENGNARIAHVPPYPRVLLGGSRIRLGLDILGTDATANSFLNVLVGVLG